MTLRRSYEGEEREPTRLMHERQLTRSEREQVVNAGGNDSIKE